ncbi:MAG: hypothetical protein ABIK92_08580 [Pseudomonadota bacterium]
MEIGTAQFATGIAVKVFDDFLKELQVKKAINHVLIEKPFHLIEGNNDLVINGHAQGDMQPPVFKMHEKSNGQRYTRLDINGTVTLWVSSPTAESPPLFVFDISASLIINMVLKPRTGKAPLVGLQYDGIENYSGPLPKEDIEQLILDQNLGAIINAMEFDLITPMIDAIEDIYGPQPDGLVIGHDEYQVYLKLMKGDDEHVDAFGLLVDFPIFIDTDMPVTVPSFVPTGSEVVFHTSRNIMDSLLQSGEQTLRDYLGNYSEHITVKRLNIWPEADYIAVDGKIEDNYVGAEGTINGPFYFHLFPGSKNIYLDMRQVNIGIDLPWWLDVIVFLIGESDTVDEIPDIAQEMISKTANKVLRNLTSSLDLDLDIEGVKVIVYPDRLKLNNGYLTLYIQVLSHPITEKLERASYSSLRRKFMTFELKSGRKFAVEDLAKFMSEGLVTVPGYHQVGEKYVRANPDESKRNNLYERWGRP